MAGLAKTMSDMVRVQMPDGNIVEAPSDATRDEIMERYVHYQNTLSLKSNNPGEYDPDSPEFKAKYGATSGMSGAQKVAANIGAGATNLWQGLKQITTFDDKKEKKLEGEIKDKRALDEELARNTKGGKWIQVGGEILPTLALPGGLISKGITSIPKIGAAAKAAGIGARALPTAISEGAITGTALGGVTPTVDDESTLGNMLVGGVGGAAIPGAVGALGALARKYLPPQILRIPTGTGPLLRRAAARDLATDVGKDMGAAERSLAGYQKRVQQGIDEPPMSTAMVTQNNKLAERELKARASPDTSGDWAGFDEALDNARWDILDRNIGSARTVDDAIQATRDFMDHEAPRYLAKIKQTKLAPALDDFTTGLQQKLLSPDTLANPAARAVYGHIASTARRLNRHGYDWTPDTLWSERKTLSGWLNGRPPPGKEAVRAPKLDTYLMEARNAIDATLNRASGNNWSRFLSEVGDRMAVEGQQKAGQNIRNVFFDEALGVAGKTTTAAGTPKVTLNALRQAFRTHGKNKFGPRLDSTQEDAVRTVLGNLDSAEVLSRARATMTGRGGSPTAPLLNRYGQPSGGGDVSQFLRWLKGGNEAAENQIVSDAMISPEFALRLLRSGKAQLSPMNYKQLLAIAAGTRTALPLEAQGAKSWLTPDPVEEQ